MKIKFNPTGIIFELPENICKNLIENDRCNYALVKESKSPAKTETSAKKPSKTKVVNVKGEKTEKPEDEAK